MSRNREYAKFLKEKEGYERKIVAFKLCDEIPEYAEPYGDDFSLYCALVAEIWQEDRKPFYITNKNIICGGAVYSGLGQNNMTKEEFDAGMTQVIGINHGYATRETMRRVNQQIPHHFIHHRYQVIGALEDIEDPDVVMIVTDAYRVMRLTKVYTWKTGELVPGLSGTAWCTNSFPLVYNNGSSDFSVQQNRVNTLKIL